ncbi:MAG: ABC transporter substrate-binding protein, partial [Planctomycetota bacterium]
PGRGRELSRSVEQYLDSRSSDPPAASRPSVYVELYGPFKTMGRDTYLDDLLTLAGGRNIAAGATGSVLLSPEHLLGTDPEVILFVDEFTSLDRLADRSGLNRLSALHRGTVHGISRHTLVAGAGLPEVVDRLRHLIHEE